MKWAEKGQSELFQGAFYSQYLMPYIHDSRRVYDNYVPMNFISYTAERNSLRTIYKL